MSSVSGSESAHRCELLSIDVIHPYGRMNPRPFVPGSAPDRPDMARKLNLLPG